MKKSEQLFYLVKSLTKSEKRSFKLFAKINSKGEQNNYTVLFDELDRMASYDHGLLTKNLHKKVNTKNISQLKNQLSDVIMRSLLQYSAVGSRSIEVNSNINFITILFIKGLTSQASDLIIKTKAMAIESEDYLAIDRLSIFEYMIALSETDKGKIESYLNNSYPDIIAARKLNQQAAEMERLMLRMRAFYLENTPVSKGVNEEELEKIMDDDLLKNDPSMLPFDAVVNYHAVWGHYYYLKGDPEKTYYYRKNVVKMIDAQAGYPPSLWMFHARLLLVGLSYSGMKKEFDMELERIRGAIKNIPRDRIGNFVEHQLDLTLMNIQLDMDIKQSFFSKATTIIPDIEAKITAIEAFVDTNLKMTLQSNFVTAYIGRGDYKTALSYINGVMNNPEMQRIRINSQCYNKLKNIVIHYSLGNYSLIDSLIKSTSRFFKKTGRDNTYVDSFLKFARRYLLEPYSEKRRQVFLNQIEALENELEQLPWNVQPLEYFNAGLWLQSIVEKCPMDELQKNK